MYFDEEIIKQSEKLPKKIKYSVEKGKLIENKWDDNNDKLNSFINDCINIENNIKDIKLINDEIKKCINLKNNQIYFYPEKEEDINNIINEIKILGKIGQQNSKYEYKFRKCSNFIEIDRQYEVTGEKENILTKTSKVDKYIFAICQNSFVKGKIYKWKIKILKSKKNDIFVGVAPIGIKINFKKAFQYGWFFCLNDAKIYSYLNCKKKDDITKLKIPGNEIIIVMDMIKSSLKFIRDNEDKGDSFTEIPLDDPITPAVILYHSNDSIQINECLSL